MLQCIQCRIPVSMSTDVSNVFEVLYSMSMLILKVNVMLKDDVHIHYLCPCLCCKNILHVHTELTIFNAACPFCSYLLHGQVHAVAMSLSMFFLHVLCDADRQCKCFMYFRGHVYVLCSCYVSLAILNVLHVNC